MLEQIGGDLVPVLAIICGFLFVSIWIIAATVQSVLKTLLDNKLKAKLVDRGFSATEIARVIDAGQPLEEAENERRPTAPVKTGSAY